jgi:hypothetical protein
MMSSTTGSCLCGRVRWKSSVPLRAVLACHCTQCRKTSGHFASHTSAPLDALSIEGEEALTWYRSSASAQRGFCSTCGSALFWRPEGEPRLSIAAGSIDGASGLLTTVHIYCADKGDYYEIRDGVAQFPGDH